jgi:heterodisulfide reductase subunit A
MTDSILIVGGGIAGLHAATECANGGARAIVVEQGPVVGGKLAAPMTEVSAIGDRAEGVSTPLFEALTANENIELITLARLENIEGRPGNFTVSIRERARFVTDACTRCKLCRAVCPVVVPNEFDAGLTYRKAIYTPMGETLPEPWVINIDDCLNTPPNYLPCNRCIEVCEDDAIFFNLPLDTVHKHQVGAVILAPGFQIEGGADFSELGYGTHPDILMSAELQRLLESPGPTGGYASKPSNEEYPESVLLVVDDPSQFALYIIASQVHQLLSQPNTDSDYSAVTELAEKTGVQVHWGTMFKVDPTPENTLNVSYENFSAKQYVQDTYDMVVLCSDVQPPEGLADLAQTTGVKLADNGYLAISDANGSGVAASEAGVFVAGCASGPKNIKASIADAQAAASAALAQLDPRLLESEAAPGEQQAQAAIAPAGLAASPDDMRKQIEQLLYALIGQSDT